MTPGDTRTGAVLEAMILPSLDRGGYCYQTQVDIGERPGGGRHKIDVLAERESKKILISLKWQQVSGTAEQKVPFEIICLLEAMDNSNTPYEKAYLVLGGNGWKLKDYYLSGKLSKYLKYEDYVNIVSLEEFVALANSGKL